MSFFAFLYIFLDFEIIKYKYEKMSAWTWIPPARKSQVNRLWMAPWSGIRFSILGIRSRPDLPSGLTSGKTAASDMIIWPSLDSKLQTRPLLTSTGTVQTGMPRIKNTNLEHCDSLMFELNTRLVSTFLIRSWNIFYSLSISYAIFSILLNSLTLFVRQSSCLRH